jgi:hypothetical protein
LLKGLVAIYKNTARRNAEIKDCKALTLKEDRRKPAEYKYKAMENRMAEPRRIFLLKRNSSA